MHQESEKTAVVKDHKNTDQLLIYANYVTASFDAIFETSHVPELKVHEGTVSLMLFDMALLYIKYSTGDDIICVVSLYDEANLLLIAELMCMLKDIFKDNIYVNDETYIHSPIDGGLIWGREKIDNHNEKVWGRKVTHTVWFDDTMAGHS